MRLDKFLKVSRILKRRTVANEACDKGRVDINGKQAKPAAQVKPGDIVSVHFAKGEFRFRILDTRESVRKEQAENMYEVLP